MHRLLVVILLLAACQKTQSPASAPEPKSGAESVHLLKHSLPNETKSPETVEHVTPMPVCDPHGLDPLSAARKYYDDESYEQALSCASEATAVQPDNAVAHSERGAALTALGKYDDAQLAYARALAQDPEDLDSLLGAAHLYTVTLPSNRERDELGSVYAERGLSLAEDQGDKSLVAEFALLSAMAFNDLGESKQALARAEQTLRVDGKNRDASYERAVALFELCRFSEAKAAFTTMLDDADRGAHAHHHLALILEREGNYELADKHFAKARELSPEDFPAPVTLSVEEFKAEVLKAVSALPADMRKDLKGVPVTPEELPKDEDLLSGDPPLSPAILGLFRGPSLSEQCDPDDGEPCRSVALYRRNLARAVRSRGEMIEQIRVTLLHEIGHLRGEDDVELAARGLE